MLDPVVVNGFLKALIVMAAPLIIASTGGIYCERAGIFPIGMEGMMLVGAFASVLGSKWAGNPFIGAVCGMLAGALLSIIFAYLTINRKANQVVVGLAVILLAAGVVNWLAPKLGAKEMERVALFPVISPASLKELPILGPIIFQQPIIIWLAILLPIFSTWFLFHTPWGLNIRAVGENPEAAEAAGISVIRWRYIGVIIHGLFAGLGGSALALAEMGLFSPEMIAGRGFIVLATHIVGKWNPISVAAACILFGSADALAIRAQLYELPIPYQVFVAAPYVVTLIALAGIVGRTNPPKALGIPYSRQGR